jgi:hypothetical protein
MNVEIGVAPAAAATVMTVTVVTVMVRALTNLCQLITQVLATPILTLLRQGNNSLSAIPGDINFTQIGGEAVFA